MSQISYEVILKRSAEKDLDALPQNIRSRITRRLLTLEGNPRPQGTKKLQAQGGYRLRVGDYRVLYLIDDQRREVMVYAVGHRRDVYR